MDSLWFKGLSQEDHCHWLREKWYDHLNSAPIFHKKNIWWGNGRKTRLEIEKGGSWRAWSLLSEGGFWLPPFFVMHWGPRWAVQQSPHGRAGAISCHKLSRQNCHGFKWQDSLGRLSWKTSIRVWQSGDIGFGHIECAVLSLSESGRNENHLLRQWDQRV